LYNASDEDDFEKIVEPWCVASLLADVAVGLTSNQIFRTLCSDPCRGRITGDEDEESI